MAARQPSSPRRPPPGEDAPVTDFARHDRLWRDYGHSRDRLARNRLVLAFVPLVKDVASRSRRGLPASVDVADLESDGYIGLMDAVERFDPQRGSDFRAYAAPRIRGAIVDGLRGRDWVPRTVRQKIRDLRGATTELERRHGRLPLDREVAAELRIPRARLGVIRAQISYARLVSLDAGARGDRLVAPAHESEDARSGAVREAVGQLPERERRVISMSYWERLTLAEIGHVLGLSESRVSQLRTRARRALRQALSPGVATVRNADQRAIVTKDQV